MAENKTRQTAASVDAFLDAIADPRKQADARALVAMMSAATGEPPAMWGPSIVGFGRYHYRYDSGREGDFMRVGFAPRKSDLTLYLMSGFDAYDDLLGKLGKHKTGKACLYLKRLGDVDLEVLRALIDASVAHMAERYST